MKADDEEMAEQVGVNVLGTTAHIVLLEARDSLTNGGFDFSHGSLLDSSSRRSHAMFCPMAIQRTASDQATFQRGIVPANVFFIAIIRMADCGKRLSMDRRACRLARSATSPRRAGDESDGLNAQRTHGEVLFRFESAGWHAWLTDPSPVTCQSIWYSIGYSDHGLFGIQENPRVSPGNSASWPRESPDSE